MSAVMTVQAAAIAYTVDDDQYHVYSPPQGYRKLDANDAAD